MKKYKKIKGCLASCPTLIFLPSVSLRKIIFHKWHVLIIISGMAALFSVFPYRLSPVPIQEEVSLVEVQREVPPPLPPADLPEPEKKLPEPVEKPSEQIHQEDPGPQFGIPDEATDAEGDMAVATGNTLLTQADSVVKLPPPPAAPQVPSINTKEIRDTYTGELAMLLQYSKNYPRMARRLGQEGVVNVRFTIESDGHFSDVSVTQNCTFDILNEAALQTVLKLGSFKPIPHCLQIPKLVVTIPIVYDVN